jgi:hypothetical protein
LFLIETGKNKTFGSLSETQIVNLTETGTQLTICAKTEGSTKVSFFFDGILVGTDGSRPFCLGNDYKSVYEPVSFVGFRNVTAVALNANNLPLDTPYSVVYEVAQVPITNFRLLKVTEPLPEIEILSNFSVVSRQKHGLSLTICAEAAGAVKVALYFDGILLRRDGSVPFCLDDNMDRKYQPIVDVRPHTVTAQALDGKDRVLGPPYTIVFDVASVPITSLFLVKTTDPVPAIVKLLNSTVLNRGSMGLELTVCAEAPGAERVNFYLDGSLVQRDDSVPFCFQDNYSSKYAPLMAVGDHTVMAQALDSSNLIIGPTYTVTYTVVPVPIVELSLIKSTEPLPPIGSLPSMSTLNIAQIGTELTVCAIAEGAVKVAFYFDGGLVRRDGSLPFCIDDHLNSKYNGLSVVGPHSVFVQALDGSDNPIGPRMDVYFTVVNGARKKRRMIVETNAGAATSGSPSSTMIVRGIQQSRFQGASGEIFFFDQGVEGMGRDYQGMTVGLYNIHPRPVNITSGKRSFCTVLISKYTQSSGWQDLPGVVQISRDGTPYEENLFRRFFDYHYLSSGVRIVGLILMGIAWFCLIVLLGLACWLRNVPEMQRVPPFCFHWLCLGSLILSSTIFTLSWDENAGWTNGQLNILCTMTPWLFFLGQILHFSTFWCMLCYYWKNHREEVPMSRFQSVGKFWIPILLVGGTMVSVLTAQTILDPWTWHRTVIREIPAETYGECSSVHFWAYVGPLMGLVVVLECGNLVWAWKLMTTSGQRDCAAILYTCFAHLQAWFVGGSLLAVLEDSSVDAIYMGRMVLIWILAISDVLVVVIPHVIGTIGFLWHPDAYWKRHAGRVKITNIFIDPSSQS